MATIEYFTLKNFRGASDVKIVLDGKTDNRIITLVGLNESGKTTILEGLSHFPTNDVAVSSMFRVGGDGRHAESLVPAHNVGNFNGTVNISGLVNLSDDDRKEIRDIVKAKKFELDTSREIHNIRVSKIYEFKNGDFVPSNFSSHWDGIVLYVRRDSGEKFVSFERPKRKPKPPAKDLWLEVADHIERKMPNILYFPNFIVDMPTRIYLDDVKTETTINGYYRRMLGNALFSKSNGYTIEEHVLSRMDKLRRSAKTVEAWRETLRSGPERDKLEAVFNALSAILSEEVIGSWSKIFGRVLRNTRVDVKWFMESGTDRPYVELKIASGHSTFHLRQRSLGFRWFFAFLLFTRFGGERGRRNIILLDEPAANLHAKAQAELRESFGRLAEAGDTVIYSTHSHHLVGPEWLAGAYIVENDAIDYDQEDVGVYGNPAPTNIKVTPYRRFVGENGSRISYFQPVLEKLQYVEPSIVGVDTQIMVEGISDFYAFQYVKKRSAVDVTIIPGGGAGSLDAMISIAMSRGYRFSVVLDDDEAGRKAQKRYRAKFHLDAEICTIRDFDVSLEGKALEGILSKGVLQKVADAYGGADKGAVANYMAESCATGVEGALDEATVKAITNVIDLAIKAMSKD